MTPIHIDKTISDLQNRTLEDLVADADVTRTKLNILKEDIEAQRRKECTFVPDTSKPKVMGYYAPYEPPAARAKLSIAAALKEVYVVVLVHFNLR